MNARYQPSFLWSLVLSLALSAAACTTTHEAPQSGTETGNPPVIDASLISLVVSQDEVHVRGAAGAATPAATIEATSALTGTVFRGQAAADGSFDLRVDAPITDSFAVRALQGGQSSSTVYVVRGGASVGQGRSQSLSCMQRDELARAQMNATAESADARCTRDEDCVLAPANTSCSDSCADVPVSNAGALELAQARAAIESGLCKDFEADACNFLVLPCVPPVSTSVGCREQRCQLREPGGQPDAGTAIDAGVPTDAGTQTDAGGSESCPSEMPLRGTACSGTLTCDYGECVLDWWEQATCIDGKWASRNYNCWGGGWGPVRAADCASDFDPGTGEALFSVYWYYPRAGVCLPRTYGGLDGNDNRYDTLAACEAACSRSGECPPNRVETSICVEPGPAGGCARSATACALLCAEPGQLCEDEQPGWWCTPRGLCEGSAPD